MHQEIALHFRDELREARAIALKDNEAFEQVVFVIERIGVYLTHRIETMGKYRESVSEKANKSPLAEEIPAQSARLACDLYDLVRSCSACS
jgi:hypothetical protein